MTDCIYLDKETGWCKKHSDWTDAMPVIEYCLESPCCDYAPPKEDGEMTEQKLINANALFDTIFDIASSTRHDVISVKDVLNCICQHPAVESRPLIHAKWILSESPYAEHEEAVDGESHPRYICSNCHHEAGFDCDPDGFAGDQDLTKWCGGCSARMDLKEDS